MKLWKFTGENRKNVFGKCYSPGMTVMDVQQPSVDFIPVKGKNKDLEDIVIPQEKQKEIVPKTKKVIEVLSGFKMQVLRKIGHELKVYDTKKSELIEEIVGKADSEKQIEKLIKKHGG